MLSKLFSFKDFDGHYDFRIFGIKISFRHKSKFKYSPATEYGVTREKRTPQVIVSLTSFPARINTTHLAINTILRQTFKPDRVILWLAEEQFLNKEADLPSELIKLKDLGLEIKWCEDIKSYKKLIPALKEFPNDIIVTADDDIYYQEDWLESLYKVYEQNPNNVVVQRVRRIKLDNNKIKVISNRKIVSVDFSSPSYFNQMLGGSGCLYPPNSLHNEIFNTNKALNLLPTNDDIYFWAMTILNKVKIKVAKGLDFNLYQMDLRESSLSKINNALEQNIEKDPFKIMYSEYPQILHILKEDI